MNYLVNKDGSNIRGNDNSWPDKVYNENICPSRIINLAGIDIDIYPSYQCAGDDGSYVMYGYSKNEKCYIKQCEKKATNKEKGLKFKIMIVL